MKNFIPRQIQEHLKNNRLNGEEEMIALFVDISGFTAITESLMKNGDEGAEYLSSILYILFPPLIHSIYSRGGFISSFAGDAFTALFPSQYQNHAAEAAIDIQKILSENSNQNTPFGDFLISGRVGIANGTVEWGIVVGERHKTYYYRGAAIDNCSHAEKKCEKGEIVFHSSLRDLFPEGSLESSAKGEDYYRLENAKLEPQAVTDAEEIEIENDILDQFFPDSAIHSKLRGEFRNIVSLFLGFENLETTQEINNTVEIVLKKTSDYGGYFNGLHFGDKGCYAHIIFGAPSAHEDETRRAADLSFELKNTLSTKIKIGITYGTVYSGIIGSIKRCSYTVLGSAVNLAAGLMESANPGEIYVSKEIQSGLETDYEFEKTEPLELVGRSESINAYRLTDLRSKTEEKTTIAAGKFLGREIELSMMENAAKPLLTGKRAAIFFIYGDPGIGKSRLLEEFEARWNSRASIFRMTTDGILKKSLHPFSHFFREYFKQNSFRTNEEKKTAFNEIYDELLAESGKPGDSTFDALEQAKSFIGAMIGLYEKNSLYDILDAESRYENTQNAVKSFFRAKSKKRPCILLFDDIHWIDTDSATAIRNLYQNTEELPIALFAACRYNNNGSAPSIRGLENIDKKEARLDRLPKDLANRLIEEKIGCSPDEPLQEFLNEKGAGNPFYLEQFCLYLKDNNLIQENDGKCTLRAEGDELPHDIDSILISRINKLPEELKEAVWAASTLGREFHKTDLSSMLESENFESILKQGELEHIWTPASEERFSFSHNLLYDAICEMQSGERLKILHEKAAELIEKSEAGNPASYEDIAYHYEISENREKTKLFLEKAGEFAARDYKNDKALFFYKKLFNYLTTEQEKIELIKKKGAVQEVIGEWDEALETLESGFTHAAAAEKPELETAKLKMLVGALHQKKGDYESAETSLTEAASFFESSGDMKNFGEACMFLGRTMWSRGDYPEALAYFHKSIAARDSAGDMRGKALSLYYAGAVHRDNGENEEAISFYKRSQEIFEELNERRYLSYPLYDTGIIYLHRGDLQNALEFFKEAETIYTEIGYQNGISAALLNLGIIEERIGNFDDALKFYRDSLQIAEELGEKLAIAYTLFSIGANYYRSHRYEPAMVYFEKSFSIMKEIGARGYYGYVHPFLACTYARTGKSAKALKAALIHQKSVERTHFDSENGRALFAAALTLERKEKFGPNALKYLDQLEKLTSLPGTPEAFYEAALEAAKGADYSMTLIPVLREYARYIYKTTDNEDRIQKADAYLNEAKKRALQSGMLNELERISAVAEFKKSKTPR